MSEYLAHEVVVEILSRLPTKSLLKFRCVCKSWCSLIADPSFISLHRSHSPSFLLLHLYNHQRSLFRSLSPDRTLSNYSLSLPLPSDASITAMSHCHGLLCLSQDYTHTSLIICNPSLRRFLSLPKPRSYPVDYLAAFAFGFDSRTRDYKIVRITSKFLDGSHGRSAPMVEVYSLASGIWRSLAPGVAPVCAISGGSANAPYSFVNGHVHWGANRRIGEGVHNWYRFVLSFDFIDEVFHEIALPSVPFNLSERLAVVVGGSDNKPLAVYLNNGTSPGSGSIWVMKEYGVVESWNILFAFDVSRCYVGGCRLEAPSFGVGITGMIGLPRVLFITNDGEILLLTREENGIMREENGTLLCTREENGLELEKLYFVDAEKRRSVALQHGGGGQLWCNLLPAGYYAESLVLLNNIDGLHTY